jgi:AAA domain
VPFSLRPATRAHVWTLTGLAGGTGSGKTYTACRLAAGIMEELAPGQPFALIDTENDRALHYADFFHFEHGNLRPPFRPANYLEAIQACAAAGHQVIVVDSFSHEHEGEGGLNEWHDEELERLARGNDERRDKLNLKAWIVPKTEHRKMMQRLLQVQAHIILCMRASDQIEVATENNKTVYRPKQSLVGYDGWVPICEKRVPYETTALFMFFAQRPGVPHAIKLQEQHRHLFPPDVPIEERSGRELAKWARGGAVDWVARIEGARTTRELQGIADQIKAKGLPDTARAVTESAFKHRWNTLVGQTGAQQS